MARSHDVGVHRLQTLMSGPSAHLYPLDRRRLRCLHSGVRVQLCARAAEDHMSGSHTPSMPARADRLGVALSLGCAVHCLAVPLLGAVLPAAGIGWLMGGRAEALLLGTSLVLAAGSLCWGVRVHGRRGVFLLLGVALTMIRTARLSAEASYERALVFVGALCLTASHLLNRHCCRACAVCPDEGREGAGDRIVKPAGRERAALSKFGRFNRSNPYRRFADIPMRGGRWAMQLDACRFIAAWGRPVLSRRPPHLRPSPLIVSSLPLSPSHALI